MPAVRGHCEAGPGQWLSTSPAHVGVSGASEREARASEPFAALLGFAVEEGNSSFFADGGTEMMKRPYQGVHGHIAIGTPDMAAAPAELEAKGFVLDPSAAKHLPDSALNAIYLTREICGFAVHRAGKKQNSI